MTHNTRDYVFIPVYANFISMFTKKQMYMYISKHAYTHSVTQLSGHSILNILSSLVLLLNNIFNPTYFFHVVRAAFSNNSFSL